MTSEAHRLLNAARDGADISEATILRCLRATGDVNGAANASRLYVQPHDLKYAPPGVGMSMDGRLCSRCHKPSRSLGGGLLSGRWYCAGCKPTGKKEKTVAPLSKWTKAVHRHCLSTQTGITPAEAIVLFGVPPTSGSASAILNSALRHRWFRREEWHEQGATGLVRRSRYFAVDKAVQPARLPDNRQSYFAGLKRCRSIFELGSVL